MHLNQILPIHVSAYIHSVVVAAAFRHCTPATQDVSTAVLFRRQTAWNLSGLSPKWDCSTNMVNTTVVTVNTYT